MEIRKLTDPGWSFQAIEEFYGYTEAVLGEFDFDSEPVDRYQVERKLLLEKRYLSPKYAATELGITVESVEGMAEYFKDSTSHGSPFPARHIGDTFVVKKESLDSWIREVMDFRAVWSSIPQRSAKILEEFRAIYDDESVTAPMEILEDEVYQLFPQAIESLEGAPTPDRPAVASTWCAITDKPIALNHSEHLQIAGGEKPVALRPDRVGWHALIEQPSLAQHTLGTLAQFRAFERECDQQGLLGV